MSISVLSQLHILPRLRAILAMLIAHAQIMAETMDAEPKSCTSKLLKTVQTIRRLTRTIISAEVYVYQSRLKSAMLADPKWRERVIFDLGGYWALRDWQARHRLCQQRQNAESGQNAEHSPPETSRTGTSGYLGRARQSTTINAVKDKNGQFRLPPLTRRSFGARQYFGRAEHHSNLMTSPVNAPIIVTPYELTSAPARQGPYSSPCSDVTDTETPPRALRHKPP